MSDDKPTPHAGRWGTCAKCGRTNTWVSSEKSWCLERKIDGTLGCKWLFIEEHSPGLKLRIPGSGPEDPGEIPLNLRELKRKLDKSRSGKPRK